MRRLPSTAEGPERCRAAPRKHGSRAAETRAAAKLRGEAERLAACCWRRWAASRVPLGRSRSARAEGGAVCEAPVRVPVIGGAHLATGCYTHHLMALRYAPTITLLRAHGPSLRTGERTFASSGRCLCWAAHGRGSGPDQGGSHATRPILGGDGRGPRPPRLTLTAGARAAGLSTLTPR